MRRSGGGGLLLALAGGVIVALFGAGQGAAGNAAPNHGFEIVCPSTGLCNWTPASQNGTFAVDTSHFHSGTRSLLLGGDTNPGTVDVGSDCLSPLSSGVYDLSAWYRTTSNVRAQYLQARFYSTNTCTGTPTFTARTFPFSQNDG